MKRWAFLFGSGVLHGLLILLITRWPPTVHEQIIEEVEVVYGEERGRAGGGRSATRSRGGPKNLRALVPSADHLLRGNRGAADGGGGEGDWPEEAWGSGGGDFLGYVAHARHLDQLREEIEQALFYPGILARRRITGVINARLYFDDQSRCRFKRTRVQGAQPALRIYVLALIHKICGLSFVERMGFRSGEFVDLSFDFYKSENRVTREMDEQASRNTGNVLTFQRGFTDSSLEWELGPIRGTWFAPMIFLNMPWVMENWEIHVEGKDPMRDFRE